MPSVSACVNSAMQAISSNSEPSKACPIIQKAAACYPAPCCEDPAVKASVDEQMKQLTYFAQLIGPACSVVCGSGGAQPPSPPSPPFCAAPALCLGSDSLRTFTKVEPSPRPRNLSSDVYPRLFDCSAALRSRSGLILSALRDNARQQVTKSGKLEIYLKLEWSGLRWILSSNMRPKILQVGQRGCSLYRAFSADARFIELTARQAPELKCRSSFSLHDFPFHPRAEIFFSRLQTAMALTT